jgi:hypothetical protein
LRSSILGHTIQTELDNPASGMGFTDDGRNIQFHAGLPP